MESSSTEPLRAGGAGPEDGTGTAGSGLRALATRFAAVCAIAAGLLIAAGAAAHADGIDPSALGDAGIVPADTVSTTVARASQAADPTLEEASDTVSATADQASDTISTASGSVEGGVGDVAATATGTISSIGGGVDRIVPPGIPDPTAVRHAVPTLDPPSGHTRAAAGVSQRLTTSPPARFAEQGVAGVPGGIAVALSRRPLALPHGSTRGSTPGAPVDYPGAGSTLLLLAVMLLRYGPDPPASSRPHPRRTLPFNGAAVAQAVERPG